MRYNFAACCARNGSGQAAAEPRIDLMKSRRRLGPSPGSGQHQSARSLADWGAAVMRVVPDPMSALGHKRTFAVQNGMSALPPIADMCGATRYVRFVSKADILRGEQHVETLLIRLSLPQIKSARTDGAVHQAQAALRCAPPTGCPSKWAHLCPTIDACAPRCNTPCNI